MAKIDFDTFEKQGVKDTSKQNNKQTIGYFNTLKDDGDETIVRFNYKDTSEFELVTVHSVQVGDKWRRISCLRSAFDPLDKCPLCARGDKILQKFYVQLIEYKKDENGNVIAEGKIWERPAMFAKELKSFIEEYGDIRDFVFKIKRRGVRGSMQTTYDIIPANAMIYKDDIYVKDFSCFDNFDISKHSYFVKTKDELEKFVATGEFPTTKVDDVKQATPQPAVAPTYSQESIDPTVRQRRTYQY